MHTHIKCRAKARPVQPRYIYPSDLILLLLLTLMYMYMYVVLHVVRISDLYRDIVNVSWKWGLHAQCNEWIDQTCEILSYSSQGMD